MSDGRVGENLVAPLSSTCLLAIEKYLRRALESQTTRHRCSRCDGRLVWMQQWEPGYDSSWLGLANLNYSTFFHLLLCPD
jgi:hypothetical protein